MSFRPANHRAYWSAGLLSLLAIFWLIRWHVMGLDAEVRREGLSSQVVVASRSLLLDALDIETGLRGYLISSREEFLRPYHEGLGRLHDDYLRLEGRTRDDKIEAPHVAEAGEITKGLLGEFANQIAVSQTEGMESARTRFLNFPTKPAMDLLRGHLSAIQIEEGRRLDVARVMLDRSLATTIWLLNGGSLVVLVTLACLASGFVRPPVDSPRDHAAT